MSRRGPHASTPWLLGLSALLIVALAASLALVPGRGAAANEGAPSVTGVEVTSDAGDDNTYFLGETITVTVTFSEAVNVTGTPQIKIDMDPAHWGTKVVDYQGGSGTASLTFNHEVIEPNYSTQGIAVLENSLALNGGTIRSSSGVNAVLTHTGLGHDAEHKVDWTQSPPALTVTGVKVSSAPSSGDTYALGETITVAVTFSEAVNVTGTPQIKIDMDPAAWGTKVVDYARGSGSASLTFDHEVVQPNYSSQGIAVLANSLQLNGGTIKSAVSQTNADLSHVGRGHDADHKVNWQQAPSQPDCSDAPPDNVVAIRGDSGIVVSWTTPDAVGQCNLTGFLVTVEWSEGGLTAVSELTALPAETTVTVPDLGLDDYEITVSAQYEARPRTSYHHVPATCTIQLTVVSDFDNGVTGSWTTSHDTCESSFRIQHRKPGRTAWDESHSVLRPGVERAFLYGGLDPVQYEFRVQTTDEHGVIHNSNGATVMVLQDAAAGMAVGRPENVRVDIAPFEHGLFVRWDDPLEIPAGKRVSGFYVEYQLASALPTSAWTRARREITNPTSTPVSFVRLSPTALVSADSNMLLPRRVVVAVPDDPNTPANEAVAAVNHGLADLTKDTAYRVRVLTELTDTSNNTVKTTVASTYTKPIVVRHETLSMWWIGDTPSYNPNIGRIFLQVAVNHPSASAICDANGAKIDCAPGTLVSLVAGTGTYTVSAITTGTLITTNQGSLAPVRIVIPSDTAGKNAVRGDLVSGQYFASGSDDTMYVRWKKVSKAASAFESYLIQTKKSGGDWVTTVVAKTEADDRHGLSDWIDYELSADQLKNCHSGLDPAPLATCQANSASGEYEVRIRVRTVVGTGASQRNVDGPSTPALSRTVGGGRSGIVTNERIDHIGTGKLRVSWEPPETLPDNVYGYRVRWRLADDPGATWQTRDIFPREYLRHCSFTSCTNPRSVDLTGLQSGKRYIITVAVFDADGEGISVRAGGRYAAPD
ncbi:MAG: fibronectin type III domain-containing protein [Chloroflexi bacterium]|nr:fibronectin type III domain-containing protein [Chloroflexota bacterium]